MNWKLTPVFLSILILSNTACKEEKKATPNQQKRTPSKVDGFIVKPESYAEVIESPGSIVANEVTEIHPEVSGRIVMLNVREGQMVAAGTVLAKIYDGDLQAQLKKLEAQLNIARVNENRASQLLSIQGISKQDYDNADLSMRNIQADIAIIQTEIARTIVRAPFSGRMGLKDISPGAYVTPATVIASINQTSTLKLDFTIPEKYSGKIHNGQIVTFHVEGKDENFAARVSATESNVALSNRSLTVRATVIGNKAGLIPGIFAKVKIGFSPNSNTIFIPTQSVVPTARGKQVILVNNGTALFSEVETGIRDSSRVEITRGLKAGDTVLVTGVMATKPNSKVSIGNIIN